MQIIRFPLINIIDNIFQIPLNNNENPISIGINNDNVFNENEDGNGNENTSLENNETQSQNIDQSAQNIFINNNFNNFIDIIENYLQNSIDNEIMNLSYEIPVQENIPEHQDVIIALDEKEFEDNIELINLSDNLEFKECLVCLEDFNENDKELVKIKCNHIFHKNCINKWLCYENNKCPVCRIEIGKGIPKNL